ncbi:MAG: hypothetical protein HY905_23505 [Deltaproteobacteria bacterium]|nr:hypothetical protein [Deltaproteobacteria bacterium]
MRMVGRGALVVVIGAGWMVAGCASHGRMECGVDLGGGQARFCAGDGSQVCICATNRCARVVEPGECPAGYRYVDDDGACVEGGAEGSSAMPSSAAGHVCPAGDADADADGDGEGDGDADGADGLPLPTLGEPVEIGGGEQPRVVPFGDVLMAEWISDQSSLASADEVVVQLVDSELQPVGAAASVTAFDGGPANLRLNGATTWATCGAAAGDEAALFGHWLIDETTGQYYPRLLWAHRTGPTAVEVLDRTDELADAAYGTVLLFVVAGNGTDCTVVWAAAPGGTDPIAIRFGRVGGVGEDMGSVEVFHEAPPWTLHSETPFPAAPGAPADPPWPAAWVDADGSVAVVTGAKNSATSEVAVIGQVINAASARVWEPATDNFSVLATFEDADFPYRGIESSFYNAIGAKGQWLLAPVVLVQDDDAGTRCLHLITANRSASTPYAEDIEITGSCPDARLPAWVSGPGTYGYLAYTAWDGADVMRVMLGRTDGHGIETGAGIFEHASPAAFARLSVDAAQRAWLGWVQLPEMSMDFEYAVEHWTPELDPVAGWPEGGVAVTGAGESLPLESTATLAPPLPDGDGAIVGWTRIIDSTHRSVVLRRVDDSR